jgi:hydroxyethylthiazole kinase-like uncharacterized protein yjeF
MQTVYFSHDIKAMDAHALAAGATMQTLIDAAGKAVADWIDRVYPSCPILFFCGPGNNGADGLSAALRLSETHDAAVLLILPDAANEHVRGLLARFEAVNARINAFDENTLARAVADIGTPGLVVDAIFGAGGSRPPRGVAARGVRAINRFALKADILALDVPTGVSVDGGNAYEDVVHARHSLVLMGYKPAHLLYPAAQYAGMLHLETPFETSYRPHYPLGWFTDEDVRPITRERATHKGSYGRLVAVAGSRGFSGAGELCAKSALRSGVGTLVVGAPETTADIYRHKLTEAMTCGLPETADGGYDAGINSFEAAIKRANAVVLGPGMGDGPGVFPLVEAALNKGLPTVLDADALNALSTHPKAALKDAERVVLTPHPLELARLTGVGLAEVLRDPIASAKGVAQAYGCICMLKMAATIVASPTNAAIITTGCAGMAKGGSGDVLAGCLGALLAQGLDPFYAACLAAHICGRAGELAQRRLGMTSMLPTDTIVQLPRVFQRYERP